MSNFKEIEKKLLDTGFKKVIESKNILFYKISPKNIDLVISNDDRISRSLTLEKNKIESIYMHERYTQIFMKGGNNHRIKEIAHDILDQKLIDVITEEIILNKKSIIAL